MTGAPVALGALAVRTPTLTRRAAVAPVEHYGRRTTRSLPVVLLTPASQGSLRPRPYNQTVTI